MKIRSDALPDAYDVNSIKEYSLGVPRPVPKPKEKQKLTDRK